ncbi:hypothetical protein AVEN_228990-1 [Araneus ventricosus]|uniref:Uncharacterized protein n=1 Tax=Araneus ventricosus TaxID=182803 RepID=A0A4Y2SNI2_ARAVE|nr:hypothetical protein AVEN_228990-1 [Araneus ventricosus]
MFRKRSRSSPFLPLNYGQSATRGGTNRKNPFYSAWNLFKLANRRLLWMSFTTSEQHTDARDSRILRDNEDVQELVGWFESHDPFYVSDFVMSISTGILGDETISCY